MPRLAGTLSDFFLHPCLDLKRGFRSCPEVGEGFYTFEAWGGENLSLCLDCHVASGVASFLPKLRNARRV